VYASVMPYTRLNHCISGGGREIGANCSTLLSSGGKKKEGGGGRERRTGGDYFALLKKKGEKRGRKSIFFTSPPLLKFRGKGDVRPLFSTNSTLLQREERKKRKRGKERQAHTVFGRKG